MSMALRLIGGLIGWIWLLSIPATLGLLIYAAFFDGPWLWVLYSFIAGAVAKWLCRGLTDHGERIVIEQHLVQNGATAAQAGDIWSRLYWEGGRPAALTALSFDQDDIARAVADPDIVLARRNSQVNMR